MLELERTLRSHLDRVEARSILDLVRKSDQSQEVEEAEFSGGLVDSLAAGAFPPGAGPR
ncbi:MAG TPA: hypothetical protein VKA35_04485 [Solirubrobacterales bacterium]|nr:hypothetical protein [Solirubrobacterales bacterium]